MNILKNRKLLYKVTLAITLIIAVLLRIYSYVIFRPLWRDECSLALSIYQKSFSQLWGVLLHVQSAPPLFMSISKVINQINPLIPEYTLRLFPLICGILSVFLFYKLSKRFLKSKLAVLIINIAFAVNTQLIYYSHEFKQYSTDVAAILASILYFSKFNFEKLTGKKLILHSIIIAIMPFLSLPTLFVIAGWFITNLLQKNYIKKSLFLLLPAISANFIYYILTLRPARKQMLDSFSFLWDKGFFEFNLNQIYTVINDQMQFYFSQCKYIIIPLILLFIGIAILIKRSKYIDKLILSMLSFIAIASFLSIYPIKDRVALYLLPIILLILILPAAYFKQKILKIIFIILFCFTFGKVTDYRITGIHHEHTATMMQILKNNYREGDFVIHNDMSDSQYIVYSNLYNFHIPYNNLGVIQLSDYGEEWYYGVLDSLPKNRTYWFFYSCDIDTKPVIQFLKNWAHRNGKILFEKTFDKKSYLLYIQL